MRNIHWNWRAHLRNRIIRAPEETPVPFALGGRENFMTQETGKKALIAMSGGVDSSVAAILMQKEGYECIGVTMKLYSNEEVGIPKDHSCCSLEDVEDARSVAFRLGMRYYVMNFRDDFEKQVIRRFVHAYEIGNTPNPCIDCNRYMKFEKLYERAMQLECDCIVTGHYARIRFDENTKRWQLLRGINRSKDQSYVLCFMTQDELAHTRFPLGEYGDKEEVRTLAQEYGLVNARKHDSQDICFVPDGDYASFIERYTGRTYPEGDFVGPGETILGRHRGIIRYTIGQRKGLGLALPAPLYVKEKDLTNNRVVLAPERDLYSRGLIAEDFNWISIQAPKPGTLLHVTAKPRYRAKEAQASAMVLEDGRVELLFSEPQRAITCGQAVVLYDGEIVVGGGTIASVTDR